VIPGLNLPTLLFTGGALIGAIGTWRIWRRRYTAHDAPEALVKLLVHIDRQVWVTTLLGEHWAGRLEDVCTDGPDNYGLRLRRATCHAGENDKLMHAQCNVWLTWNYIGSVAVED
jgi:hypothetical protein